MLKQRLKLKYNLVKQKTKKTKDLLSKQPSSIYNNKFFKKINNLLKIKGKSNLELGFFKSLIYLKRYLISRSYKISIKFVLKYKKKFTFIYKRLKRKLINNDKKAIKTFINHLKGIYLTKINFFKIKKQQRSKNKKRVKGSNIACYLINLLNLLNKKVTGVISNMILNNNVLCRLHLKNNYRALYNNRKHNSIYVFKILKTKHFTLNFQIKLYSYLQFITTLNLNKRCFYFNNPSKAYFKFNKHLKKLNIVNATKLYKNGYKSRNLMDKVLSLKSKRSKKNYSLTLILRKNKIKQKRLNQVKSNLGYFFKKNNKHNNFMLLKKEFNSLNMDQLLSELIFDFKPIFTIDIILRGKNSYKVPYFIYKRETQISLIARWWALLIKSKNNLNSLDSNLTIELINLITLQSKLFKILNQLNYLVKENKMFKNYRWW